MKHVDWVKALSRWSAAEAFEKLRLQVESDVETRKALQPSNYNTYTFKFVSNGEKFSVVLEGTNREGNNIFYAVSFSLESRRITVRARDEKDTVMFSATTTLNGEGDCCLKVEGQERELWQVGKMALEDLFFNVV